MGILDKAMKAAAVAKGQFGEVRDVHAMARHKPEMATAPDEHEQHVLARAIELGAPDPYALLSLEEAIDIVGVPLGGPRLTYSDNAIGVTYSATGPKQTRWSVEVQAFYAADEDVRFDAAVHWHTFVAEHVGENGGVPVAGLGEAALARENEVFVLAEPLLFQAMVQVPQEGGDAEKALAVARRVLQRVR